MLYLIIQHNHEPIVISYIFLMRKITAKSYICKPPTFFKNIKGSIQKKKRKDDQQCKPQYVCDYVYTMLYHRQLNLFLSRVCIQPWGKLKRQTKVKLYFIRYIILKATKFSIRNQIEFT